MSLRLFVRDQPQRALSLLTETHALIFRYSKPVDFKASVIDNGSDKITSSSRSMVEFTPLQNTDLTDYHTLSASGIHGTLGLINVSGDTFICVINDAKRVATVREDEAVLRILSVEFYCLNRGDFDSESINHFDVYDTDYGPSNGQAHYQTPDQREVVVEHPCHELKKLLGSGTFYYSVDFDLTNRLQDRSSQQSAFDVDSLEDNYLWNSYMIDPLVKFRSRLTTNEKMDLDSSRILTSAIRGFVSTITIPTPSSPIKSVKTNRPSSLTLISRLSCRRAGTRFNSRGIDDEGNVANFVETETVLYHPSSLCFSYAQVRGSVPLFWEQAPGLLPGQQKIQITRSPEATQPAFDKHFESLEIDYGSVHILNLLSESKPGEAELTARYKYHVQSSPLNAAIDLSKTSESHNQLVESQFDFHAETRGPAGYEAASMVRQLIQRRADSFAYFLCEGNQRDGSSHPYRKGSGMASGVILQQEGVFRTNCLDCLDRTNLIQTIISQMALEQFLGHRDEHATADFWVKHSSLWADNGDALSKIYAGTGALKSSFTRHGKMSLAGAIADARKSATRMYINNFADKGRQTTIDLLLGRLMDQSAVYLYDPITDYVNAELKKRIDQYSTTNAVKIWVGTFNLNGRANGVKEDLSPWLWAENNLSEDYPNIFAVGFQEIVELSPQQIMSTDPARRQAWEDAVKKSLNDGARKRRIEEYVLLRGGQLVGAALMIFVKTSILGKIKNVEGSVKKTGMSGIAGNKGAVAIRMDYANTRLCFVTAHLAAGFANYEERNRDYHTINHGLRFQRNRSIDSHDATIWLGDFNYRIGLSDDKVRRMIKAGNLDTLYQNDQLNLQMVAGHTFPFFSESRITFMPTYKYDNGTDEYDSSEKARIPAWCDRVLYKGDILKQTNYTTAPLRFSDHRPVYAIFRCMINDVNEGKKQSLSQSLYSKRRAEVGGATANARNPEVDDGDLIGYDSIDPGLPPASSERRKWWLENVELPARSNVRAPNKKLVLNPNRLSNPFAYSTEPDWVNRQINQRKRSIPPQSEMEKPIDDSRITDDAGQSLRPKAVSSKAEGHTGTRESETHVKDQGSTLPASSSVARKPAPPVPKKPQVLVKHSEGRLDEDNRSAIPPRPTIRRPQAQLSSNGQQRVSALPTQNLPVHSKGMPSETDGPPLPPRRTERGGRSSGGLLDEDNGEAKSIPSLEPARKI